MVVQFVKPVLGPVIRAQAARIRRVALALPEPNGPRSGEVGILAAGAPPLTILVAGDSSAAGVGAPTQALGLAPQLAAALALHLHNRVVWHVIARTGLTSEGVLEMLQQEPLPNADLAVVVLGVNDISHDVPLRHALRRRNRIVRWLRENAGVRWCVFPALPEVERFPLLPQPLAWYGGAQARQNNALQARWASNPRRNENVWHVPMDGVMHPSLMAEDGFHPAPPLYARVAARLSEHIAARIQPATR